MSAGTQGRDGGARAAEGVAAPRRRKGEIRALTGLRIVAALWVVLFHFGPQLRPLVDQLPPTHAIVSGGWIGVELFFVLSGFVIARGYVERFGTRFRVRDALDFAVNRFARVWPAWAVITLLTVAFLLVPRLTAWPVHITGGDQELGLRPLLRQLTMTQMWLRPTIAGSSFDPPGWSISAEWLAYLCFPLLAVLLWQLRRLHPAVNLVLAVVALLPLAADGFVNGHTDMEVDWLLRIACGFTAGVLTWLGVSGIRESERADQWGSALVNTSIAGAVVTLLWANWRTGVLLQEGHPLQKFVEVTVVFWPTLVAGLAMTERGAARFLSSDAMVYGGRISYCLYLTHWLVRDVGMALVWWRPETAGRPTPGAVLVAPALVVVALAVSSALHHGVEEPGRRLLLSLWRRLVPASPAARVAPGVAEAPVFLPPVPDGAAVHRVDPTPRPLPAAAVGELAGDHRTTRLTLPPQRTPDRPVPARPSPVRQPATVAEPAEVLSVGAPARRSS